MFYDWLCLFFGSLLFVNLLFLYLLFLDICCIVFDTDLINININNYLLNLFPHMHIQFWITYLNTIQTKRLNSTLFLLLFFLPWLNQNILHTTTTLFQNVITSVADIFLTFFINVTKTTAYVTVIFIFCIFLYAIMLVSVLYLCF